MIAEIVVAAAVTVGVEQPQEKEKPLVLDKGFMTWMLSRPYWDPEKFIVPEPEREASHKQEAE